MPPAETVAVFGIGGLGHLGLQYARIAGRSSSVSYVEEPKLEMATEPSGSVENSMVSDRQGRRFHFLQTLTIVTCDRPSSAASDRLDQCVTPSPTGGDLQRPDDDLGLVDDCCGLRPGLGRSSRPAKPSVAYRRFQAITLGLDTHAAHDLRARVPLGCENHDPVPAAPSPPSPKSDASRRSGPRGRRAAHSRSTATT